MKLEYGHILCYMLCSSLLLIVNKLSVEHNDTCLVLAFQLLSSSLFSIPSCYQSLNFSTFMEFYWVSNAFLLCLSANMKVLQHANVETFIIFRNSTPILISILEWLFLEREFPNIRSFITLIIIFICSALYTMSDSLFSLNNYMYVVIWYCIFCFDALFIKHRVDNISVSNNWERVFYQNTWAFITLLFKFAYDAKTISIKLERNNLILVFSSCLIGIGMSYFGLSCRKKLSATYFALIGNMCKFLTIIMNVLIWEKHASNIGLICLSISLIVGYFYVQAPKRSENEISDPLLEEEKC